MSSLPDCDHPDLPRRAAAYAEVDYDGYRALARRERAAAQIAVFGAVWRWLRQHVARRSEAAPLHSIAGGR